STRFSASARARGLQTPCFSISTRSCDNARRVADSASPDLPGASRVQGSRQVGQSHVCCGKKTIRSAGPISRPLVYRFYRAPATAAPAAGKEEFLSRTLRGEIRLGLSRRRRPRELERT